MNVQVFKDKKNKKCTEEDYEHIDEMHKLIPLSFKPVFRCMIWNKYLIKKIIMTIFELEDKYKKIKLYYGQSILLSTYPSYVIKRSYIITINENRWKSHAEIQLDRLLDIENSQVYTFAQIDKTAKSSYNGVYQLILNTSKEDDYFNDKDIVLKDEKNNKKLKGFGIHVRNIEYYRKMYENGKKLKDKELILVALTSNSFKELYEILSKIYTKKDTEKFMKFAVKTSKNIKIKLKWKEFNNES